MQPLAAGPCTCPGLGHPYLGRFPVPLPCPEGHPVCFLLSHVETTLQPQDSPAQLRRGPWPSQGTAGRGRRGDRRCSRSLSHLLSAVWNLRAQLSQPLTMPPGASHSASPSLSFPICPAGLRRPLCLPRRAAMRTLREQR